MKHLKTTLIFSVLLAVFSIGSVYAQTPTPKDVFTTDLPITYLGIDFSNSKLIGDTVISLTDLPTKFEAINGVPVNEAKKYDIGTALKKTHVTNDLSAVKEQNDKIDPSKFLSGNDADYARFKEADISKIVSKYNFKGRSGVGVVFIAEGLTKRQEKASLWVTFVDMKTNKVIYTERMEGKAGGFGYRNYWVKTVWNVIEEIKKHKDEEWIAKFSK
ncbi:hypothetical protein [Pinibacter soli]|uniref:DUF4410 domain-containing protein n=1 Tax=Pinibacter soli TaxID=3044211 RepID=A0ABT6RCA6_9BACT|nr:hypothetical protein [Pinibacter soli]MDI3320101.1 hypothetical protein [Pinibacter soli]